MATIGYFGIFPVHRSERGVGCFFDLGGSAKEKTGFGFGLTFIVYIKFSAIMAIVASPVCNTVECCAVESFICCEFIATWLAKTLLNNVNIQVLSSKIVKSNLR